jgi:hypothetical protein
MNIEHRASPGLKKYLQFFKTGNYVPFYSIKKGFTTPACGKTFRAVVVNPKFTDETIGYNPSGAYA